MPCQRSHSRFNRIHFLTIITAGVIAMSGCSGDANIPGPTQPGPTITPNPHPSATATPFQPIFATTTFTPPPATATDIPQPTETLPPPTSTFTPLPPISPSTITRTQYYLNAYLDYSGHVLSAGETIFYKNQTGVPLDELELAIEPNRWQTGFILNGLKVNDVAYYHYYLADYRFEIYLDKPLNPDETISLSLNYESNLPYAGSTNVYGYNGLQTNLVDWYPFIAPYDPSQGWLLHNPSTVGEHLVYDVADFNVNLQLSDPTLTVAASAPATWTGEAWHYQLTSRDFVFSISDSYQTASTTAGPVTITAYYFGSEATAANALLKEVSLAVDTYGSTFAPPPYTTLGIVESATYPDGMEEDGIFFLSRRFYRLYDGTVRNNLITIGVHETAHQWWFGLVGDDQAMEPWLDEAMATYSELVFYETNYPYYVNWWWGFRVNSFDPSGWVDSTIYDGSGFREYVNAVYLNGANFLDALRTRIGDQAFHSFLKNYAVQMAGKRATAQDFFRILRETTNVDFSDIESSYFQHHP